jgi:hypothetical protein
MVAVHSEGGGVEVKGVLRGRQGQGRWRQHDNDQGLDEEDGGDTLRGRGRGGGVLWGRRRGDGMLRGWDQGW